MRWKYCLPHVSSAKDDRTALEDVYLVPEDGSSGDHSYWVTIEGLHSFTGGTREEKLNQLGDQEFVISDTMDMLVRRNDFSREELLGWTRTFIKARFGDPNPVLVEAAGDEVSRCTPVLHERQQADRRASRVRLLFVHQKGGPPYERPEAALEGDDRLEVHTAWFGEDVATEVGLADLEWADLILVMEKRIRHLMHKRLRSAGLAKRIICLYLPEHHDARDEGFAELFRERIFVYLDRLGWKSA